MLVPVMRAGVVVLVSGGGAGAGGPAAMTVSGQQLADFLVGDVLDGVALAGPPQSRW